MLSAAGLLVAGCSGGASSASSPGHRGPAGLAVPAPSGKYAGSAPGGTAGSGAGAGGAAGLAARLTLASQSIIYTASLTVQPRDVTTAADRATSIATSTGGYVSGEQATSTPGRSGSAVVSLTLKIPVVSYQAVLTSLSALGRRTSLDQQATDVTQQVADVGSRVASQRAAIAQLRVLLKRAGSVSQLLSVQDQINTDESSLEALLAQQRALSHETSYATVSLLLVSHHRRLVKRKKKSAAGFLTGLSRGWHAFTRAVAWTLTALGAVLPFAAVAAVLAALGYAGRRRWRRRRVAPPSTT